MWVNEKSRPTWLELGINNKKKRRKKKRPWPRSPSRLVMVLRKCGCCCISRFCGSFFKTWTWTWTTVRLGRAKFEFLRSNSILLRICQHFTRGWRTAHAISRTLKNPNSIEILLFWFGPFFFFPFLARGGSPRAPVVRKSLSRRHFRFSIYQVLV